MKEYTLSKIIFLLTAYPDSHSRWMRERKSFVQPQGKRPPKSLLKLFHSTSSPLRTLTHPRDHRGTLGVNRNVMAL